VEALAVVGNLSLDRVDGGRSRIGGGPYHAGRAFRLLSGCRAQLLARCGDRERSFLLPRLVALGLHARLLHGSETTTFSFSYAGDRREMHVDALGESWTPSDVSLDRRIRWVHVAPLLRSDFDAATLGALARGRRVLLDGQGLVRVRKTGPLALDGSFDRAVLEHVTVLKLAEDEAATLGDVHTLGVPEVLVTRGSRGATVHVAARTFDVPARPLPRDPTGAGDAFGAVYLAARADGLGPGSAARRATAAVAELLR